MEPICLDIYLSEQADADAFRNSNVSWLTSKGCVPLILARSLEL